MREKGRTTIKRQSSENLCAVASMAVLAWYRESIEDTALKSSSSVTIELGGTRNILPRAWMMPIDIPPEVEETNTERHGHGWYRREFVVLLWLTALTIALFVIAYFVTGAFRRQQTSLGNAFFQKGESELSAARANDAIRDFRAALTYAPEKREYRLRLAQALALADHDKEAEAHFKDLWEREPGDGELNLELARLAARAGDMADALRYFHGAIYGLWNKNPEENRQKAWLELIQFLLREHAYTQAQSELLALSANLPADADANAEIASLFMKAGDEIHALQFYQKALRLDRKNEAALIGAGEASFAVGNYRAAFEYFKTAWNEQSLPPDAQSQAQTAQLVLQLDPYQRGISAAERRSRTLAAFVLAGDRIKQCAASKGQQLAVPPGQSPTSLQSDLSQWTALQRKVSPRALRDNSDLIDQAMDIVYRIEEDTEQMCGEPTGKDFALLLLARERLGVGK
jgi:tetratricopeptide (TPR) repeat protein